MPKYLVCVPIGVDAPTEVSRQPGVTGWIVDEIHDDQDLIEVHGLTARVPVWSAVHWIFCEGDARPGLPEGLTALALDENVGWDYRTPRTWPDGVTTPGIKQLSFIHKARDCSDEDFLLRYRAHVPEARRHMPGLWKYVQNVVQPLPSDRAEIYGVSELWFQSLDDFRHRYWAGPDSQPEEHAEVSQFLSSRTWSLLVHEVIQPCPPAR